MTDRHPTFFGYSGESSWTPTSSGKEAINDDVCYVPYTTVYSHDNTTEEGHDPNSGGALLLVDIPANEGAREHLAHRHNGRDVPHQVLVRLQDVG